MSDTPKLADALAALHTRCSEILAAARNSKTLLAAMFSDREISTTNARCLDFLFSLAESSPAEIKASQGILAELRDITMEINLCLSDHVHANPRILAFIITAEQTIFTQILAGDPSLIALAGLIRRFKGEISAFLTAAFTELRGELAATQPKLSTLNANLAHVLKNQRSILWYVSGNEPDFKPKDGRELSDVRHAMVEFANLLLDRRPELSHRSAAAHVMRKFESVPGAYDDLDSFRKQIDRIRAAK